MKIEKLKIKIFFDGANENDMFQMNDKTFIKGLTTNPSLMKKAGVNNYKSFAKKILTNIKNKPISFEIFSDELNEMEKQAYEINSWGKNVYVKIPITNTKNVSTTSLLKKLSSKRVKLNVTAIMTVEQVEGVMKVLKKNVPSIISVFAGRIADTGRDPVPMMKNCLIKMKNNPSAELLWASTRETLNIFQANDIGCHIITVPINILSKINLIDYDLNDYSLDTVKSFYQDALKAKFKI
jgi:transaldolase|tara:strand:- start:816 stop:1529 length:714 start_codon:yes stop_codon:yes gene_type:complete